MDNRRLRQHVIRGPSALRWLYMGGPGELPEIGSIGVCLNKFTRGFFKRSCFCEAIKTKMKRKFKNIETTFSTLLAQYITLYKWFFISSHRVT